MDEAGRSTQPPLIMAPPVPKADPDAVAADTVADNGIMAPSRTRAEASRSGVAQRENRANGSSASNSQESGGKSSGGAAAATEELPVVKETADDEPAAVAPLPADIIGKGKGRTSAERAAEGQGPGWQGSRQTMTSGETTAGTEAPATVAEDVKPAPKSEQKPSFTRAEATLAPPVSASTQSYAGSTDWTPAYSHSEWPTGPDSTTTTAASGGTSGSGFSASSVGSVTAGAASAATGAAAGLAGSVTSAWQRRGSGTAPRGAQVRKKPSKRQAMLTLSRVEPWSVMKFSFVASVVAFIILFVAVALLYMVLTALGVFDSIQHTVSTMTSSQGTTGTNISHWTSPSLILGYTAMLGALNIVLITAICTVGSVIYNLIAKTIGGIEVTLRETD